MQQPPFCLPSLMQADKVSDSKNAWISACFAAGACAVAGLVGVPLIRRKVEREWDELSKAEAIQQLGETDKPQVGRVTRWPPAWSMRAQCMSAHCTENSGAA
jgi:hypothetical protein